MALLSRMVGPWKIPWVFCQGWQGRGRYHESPFKGSGAVEDAMGLLARVTGHRRYHWSPDVGGWVTEDDVQDRSRSCPTQYMSDMFREQLGPKFYDLQSLN